MKLNNKLFIASGIILVLVIGSLYFFASSTCQTNVNNVLEGNSYKVIHQVKDCGATTDATTSVLIYRSWLPIGGTNIFSLNGQYTQDELKTTSVSSDVLRIDFSGRSTDLRRVAFKANGLNIQIYINGVQESVDSISEIEKQIAELQATYGITLPEGEHWIQVAK